MPRLVRPEIPDDLVPKRATPEPPGGRKLILNDLKEQLFRLEVKHKQKRISQPDYEKAIAALHQNLEQAMRPGEDKTAHGWRESTVRYFTTH
jgi:hypothetical protein